MKLEEALQFADGWESTAQGWQGACATLAAEVRRQRENMTQLLTGLECRNVELAVNENTPAAFKLIGELIAQRAKANTDCSSQEAEAVPVDDMEDAIEKAYWEFDAKKNGYGKYALNTKSERDAFKSEMRKAIRKFGQLDAETRKLVMELCDMVQRSEGTSMAMIDAAQNIEAKLGAGNVK